MGEAIILGFIQGITEFLPISSSGHLIVFEKILGLNVEELKSFDVALHIGTLLSILVYFRKDVWNMLKTFFGFFAFKFDLKNEYTKLILFILIGTVPAVLFGLGFEDQIDNIFRSAQVVGIVVAVTSLLFFYAEYVSKKSEKKDLSILTALWIGLFQMLALIPGVSRSGATISGGLINKLSREQSARFSFLLGIPAIFGAGVLTFYQSIKSPSINSMEFSSIIAGSITSFVVGLFAISILMKYLRKHSLNVFAYYRLIFGLLIFLFI